jgi:iron complex outermembrane recepter protein
MYATKVRRVKSLTLKMYKFISTDINTIPVSAIERIEVLRDGASAIYGSDAITGVINIILKKQSEGGSITTEYGETKK